VTGPKVALHAQRQEKQLHQIANKIDCQPKQIEEKIDKLLSDQQELTSRYTKLQNSLIQAEINKAFSGNTQNVTLQGRPRKVYIYDLSDSPLNNIPFKQVVRKAKQLMPDQAWMIINDQGNYALHLGGLKISAKEFLAEHDLRGG
jgi:alanyl-tRNA synthetase